MTPSQILTLRQRGDFVERLAGPRREEREIAAHTLQSQGYDPTAFLITELYAVPSVAQWKFSAGHTAHNLARYSGELALFLILELMASVLTNGWVTLWAGASAADRAEPVYSEEVRHRKRVGRTIRALAWRDDLRVIGPLCERMNEADEDSLWRAQLTLKDLLPRLRPADAALLTPEQKLRLCHLLQPHDAQMCVAALGAIANVGDGRALPQVEALAHAANLEIRKAALLALPTLQERARREQESHTLLRGSSAPVMGGDILLRPAPPVHAANPAELLRAVNHNSIQNPKSKIQNSTEETNDHAGHQIQRSQ